MMTVYKTDAILPNFISLNGSFYMIYNFTSNKNWLVEVDIVVALDVAM